MSSHLTEVLSSLLWRCWFGGRKDIRPVKTVSCWRGYLTGARCKWCTLWSSWCHCHHIISYSSKMQNGLPFSCRLTGKPYPFGKTPGVGFNVPLNTLWVISRRVLWVRWPNQQCQSTEGSNGAKDQASIPPDPPHHVTILHVHAVYRQAQNNTYTKWN